MRGLCPRAPGIYRLWPEWLLNLSAVAALTQKRATLVAPPFRLPCRRSGRIPALPYPPHGYRLVYS